jgi:hypothetical protein
MGNGGPKKKRQVVRANIQGFTVLTIWRLARRRLGEPTQTGPWPRASFPGWWQETGAGRMGGAPTGPTTQGSPPGYLSGHRRPPKLPPDGNDAKDGDSGMKSGNPDLAAQNMEFFRQAMDIGAISAFTGVGGRSSEISRGREGNPDCADEGKLNGIMAVSESSGFFVEGEVNLEFAVRGKWKGAVAGTKGAHVRGAKVSGKAGENILSNRFTPKLKMAERNQEIMVGAIIRTLRTEEGRSVTWVCDKGHC